MSGPEPAAPTREEAHRGLETMQRQMLKLAEELDAPSPVPLPVAAHLRIWARQHVEDALLALAPPPLPAGRSPHEQELHRNYEAFKLLLPSLRPLHRDQYALMQGGEILDFYRSCAEGCAAGIERYGREGWSLQKVTDEPVCIYAAISGSGFAGGAL